MEVPVPLTKTNEREEETETKKPISPTSSDGGSCVSTESSAVNNDNNFDFDGDQLLEPEPELPPPNIVSFTPTLNFEQQQQQHSPNLNNGGTNGFSAHQYGETNAEDKETVVRSKAPSSSNTPTTPVGLQYVETLLDESSSPVLPTDAFNGLLTRGPSPDLEPQAEEYDVEKVIQKQETHDLYCPNCRSCITKRVILRRRKRKLQEISTADEDPDSGLGLPAVSDIIEDESQQPPPIGMAPDSHLDAISCFSCFSIFIPSGEGFLCWRFKPKADATQLSDGTSISNVQAEDSITDSTGTIFPLWIVTCCQPAERMKSDETAATLGSIYRPTSEDDTKAPPRQREPSLTSSDDTKAPPRQTEPSLTPSDDIPVSSTPGIFLPEHDTSKGSPVIKRPQHGLAPTLQTKPLSPNIPYGDAPSSETPSNLTTDEGTNFPLWILTCCQPSMVGTKLDDPWKLDGTAPPQETPTVISGNMKADHQVKPDGTMLRRENPSAPSGGTEYDHPGKPDGTIPQKETPSEPNGSTRPSIAPSDDGPVTPFKPKSPAIFVPGTSSPSKPINPVVSNDDIPLSLKTESPAAPGSAFLPMPHKPQPPVIPSDTRGPESSVDVETGLAPEPPRPGVSELDVIKAMVYGGLLESITSLSVITSAAGGDATTLNIVALGLANVFGGLIVLVHNLRVLKHEHTTEHYEAQLGRPGHYMLHAIVAISSYIIFGLMSPIIYGFSFRKSDNKDYKLATLAAAALVCITLLSAAKAYVRNPPKGYIKTVFYYISLGFMVSGLGYVAGDVINMLLKKFGVFDPKAADNVPGLAAAAAAAGVINGAWSSY